MLGRAAAWLAAPLLLLVMVALVGLREPTYLAGDFRAFWCAGAAIAQGADPYREQPLQRCEASAGPPSEPAFLRGVAVPAPLPPHALLPFVPLSRLPFPLAAALFAALALAAGAASVALYARATGATTLELNLAFAAVAGTVTLYVGQPVPFVLLALAGAALSARAGRPWATSACLACATVEPHLALPVLVATAIGLPATRLPLAVFLALAASAGVAALGLPTTLEYVRDVLPAHALANAYEWQYSLTSLLTSAGVDAAPAIRLGELMYGAMLLAGVAVALRLRRAAGDAAALIVIPPAFAVFGGVHVHVQQIAVAFPAALWLCVRFPRTRGLAATGVALAMIPWNVVGASAASACAPLLAGAFAAQRLGRRASLALAALAACIVLSVLVLATLGLGPAEAHVAARAYPPDALAEASWGDFSRAALMRPSALMQWLRVPTLAGVACVVVALAGAARRGGVPLPRPFRRAAAAAS